MPATLILAACAGEQALTKAALGTWDCSITDPTNSNSAGTLTIGDGTFEIIQEDGEKESGTWELDGARVSIHSDNRGPYSADGLPETPEESMDLTLNQENHTIDPWSVRWKGDTVSFMYDDASVSCTKK
ncbi:hypothetical protein ACFU9F_31365 [Streptomyces zhihengii]|uniref:hypothetical protein n=1 Tax=Streptomyces zhihengii TaxID=1818004 RepID=UPI0036AFCCE8